MKKWWLFAVAALGLLAYVVLSRGEEDPSERIGGPVQRVGAEAASLDARAAPAAPEAAAQPLQVSEFEAAPKRKPPQERAPRPAIVGRVVEDDKGTPVPGVDVTAYVSLLSSTERPEELSAVDEFEMTPLHAVTDADGRFAFDVQGRMDVVRFEATKSGRPSSGLHWTAPRDLQPKEEVKIEMPRASLRRIVVRVSDPSSRPMPHFPLTFRSAANPTHGPLPGQTDGAGALSTWFKPGEYLIESYGGVVLEGERLPLDGESSDPVEHRVVIQPRDLPKITGSIIDQHGQPVPGVAITAKSKSTYEQFVGRSDARGQWMVYGKPELVDREVDLTMTDTPRPTDSAPQAIRWVAGPSTARFGGDSVVITVERTTLYPYDITIVDAMTGADTVFGDMSRLIMAVRPLDDPEQQVARWVGGKRWWFSPGRFAALAYPFFGRRYDAQVPVEFEVRPTALGELTLKARRSVLRRVLFRTPDGRPVRNVSAELLMNIHPSAPLSREAPIEPRLFSMAKDDGPPLKIWGWRSDEAGQVLFEGDPAGRYAIQYRYGENVKVVQLIDDVSLIGPDIIVTIDPKGSLQGTCRPLEVLEAVGLSGSRRTAKLWLVEHGHSLASPAPHPSDQVGFARAIEIDAEGRFSLAGLPLGRYDLLLLQDGAAPSRRLVQDIALTTAAPTAQVLVDLAEIAPVVQSIEVRANGIPLAHSRVQAAAEGEPPSRGAALDALGRAELALPPGRYRWLIGDARSERDLVAAVAQETTLVSASSGRLVTLNLQTIPLSLQCVAERDGQPLRRTSVWLDFGSGLHLRLRTDEAGVLSFAHLGLTPLRIGLRPPPDAYALSFEPSPSAAPVRITLSERR